MSNQNITIEKNTGVVNIYNDSEEKKTKTKEAITIAAVDKYSTPLKAEIEISPWGEDMHRVSFLMKNDLIGQVVQQNYLTYKTAEKCRKAFDNLIEMITEIKDEAERKHLHSSIITPVIWNKMALLEKESELGKPESKDLLIRHETPHLHGEGFQGATPSGLVIHPVSEHFPSHGGIVKTAQKNIKTSYLKTINKEASYAIDCFDSVLDQWTGGKFDIDSFLSVMAFSSTDTKSIRVAKREALSLVRPVFADGRDVSSQTIENAINKLGEVAVWKYQDSPEIDFSKYDTFIFDADKTIWEGTCAKEMTSPFTIEFDTVTDAEGKTIVLKPHVFEVIASLSAGGKDLGIVSKSEKKGVDFQDQPVVLLLKEFGLLKYFEKMVVISDILPKSIFMPDDNRVIFIDDDVQNLVDVWKNSDSDVSMARDDIFEQIHTDIIDSNIQPTVFGGERNANCSLKTKTACTNENGDPISIQHALDIRREKEAEEERRFEEMASIGISSLFASAQKWYKQAKKKVLNSHDDNWYRLSKREYIPVKNRPKKPKGKGWELDHIVSLKDGGKNEKSNLQWIQKDKHKKKSQEGGDYEFGGKAHQNQEKKKGKKKYKEYQSNCGKARQQSERDKIGEEAYSKQQSLRAKKRWAK